MTSTYNLSFSETILSVASGLGIGLGIQAVTAKGQLPNTPPSQVEGYAIAIPPGESMFVWSVISHWYRNIVAIAGDGQYFDYLNVQCEIMFTPTSFQVSVDTTFAADKCNTIRRFAFTSPGNRANRELDVQHIVSLDLLSRISSNIGVSALGDPILKNRDAYAVKQGIFMADAKLPALEDSIQAMTDDLLVALAQPSLVLQPITPSKRSLRLRYGACTMVSKLEVTHTFSSPLQSTSLWYLLSCMRRDGHACGDERDI
jgi:hypothetical protein